MGAYIGGFPIKILALLSSFLLFLLVLFSLRASGHSSMQYFPPKPFKMKNPNQQDSKLANSTPSSAPLFVLPFKKKYRLNIQDSKLAPTSPHAPSFVPPDKSRYHNPKDSKLGKCLNKYFEDILLVIIYHFPFYDSIPLLKSFYKDAFGDILICGPETYKKSFVMKIDNGGGLFGYQCLGEAIHRYPGYRGYLYINDDMIVNWWNFFKFDKEKFWQGGNVVTRKGHELWTRPIDRSWHWWAGRTKSAKACEDSYLEVTGMTDPHVNITKILKTHLANGEGKKVCFRMWSDLFYVPGKFSEQFQRLSSVFYKHRVFLEAAVPTLMSFLDLRSSWEKHLGTYLPDTYGFQNFADGKIVWKVYKTNLYFIHPVKFHGDIARLSRENLKGDVMNYSKQFTKC